MSCSSKVVSSSARSVSKTTRRGSGKGRVRRPKPFSSYARIAKDDGDYDYIWMFGYVIKRKEIRKLAAWLLRAADYIEQEGE